MKRLLLSLVASCVIASGFASELSDSTARHILPRVAPIAGAVVLNGIATELLKGSVHEMRPDRSGNNSFPSRHTSCAFTASAVLSHELYRSSPWWSVGAQGVATAVGMQRVLSHRHWGSDVVAGATTGILTTELAYYLGRKIWGGQSAWVESPDCDFRPTLSLSTDAAWWLSSPHEMQFCAAFGTCADFRLPLAEKWGFAAALSALAMPVKYGRKNEALAIISAQAGVAGHIMLPCNKLAATGSVTAGLYRCTGHFYAFMPKTGFAAQVGTGLEWRLTERYALRGELSYRVHAMGRAVQAMALSVSSVVVF